MRESRIQGRVSKVRHWSWATPRQLQDLETACFRYREPVEPREGHRHLDYVRLQRTCSNQLKPKEPQPDLLLFLILGPFFHDLIPLIR